MCSSCIVSWTCQCSCCYILTTECSHTGLVPESPTFFNSSPFKVLSPQPPKFLKSLLPVKEENKAKKVLEARPLLGQEVRKKALKSLYLKRGSNHVFSCVLSLSQSHIFLLHHFYIWPCHLSYQIISHPQHGKHIDIYSNTKILIVQSCLKIFLWKWLCCVTGPQKTTQWYCYVLYERVWLTGARLQLWIAITLS